MRQLGSLRTDNPWAIRAWGAAAAVIVVASALGFGLLDRFQQSGPTLDRDGGNLISLLVIICECAGFELVPKLHVPQFDFSAQADVAGEQAK